MVLGNYRKGSNRFFFVCTVLGRPYVWFIGNVSVISSDPRTKKAKPDYAYSPFKVNKRYLFPQKVCLRVRPRTVFTDLGKIYDF